VPTMLTKDLRNRLARVTLAARETAERSARAALENLAVHEKDYRGHMAVEQRQLRNRLRARGRALGDTLDTTKGIQTLDHLAADVAYEHWHRLLFTRFLTENHLLITDAANGSVPVTLADCEELAPDLAARDGFDLACRFASQILPGVFRTEDPVFDLTFALNDQICLRKLLDSLEQGVFTADDSLGWAYQFWQAKKKDDVNKAGWKIGADELPVVTQLFTEDYMVDFLLDNTLGAWHAGKVLAANHKLAETAQSEDELRNAMSLPGCPWKYLRFIKGKDANWIPAAGTFDGWPKTAKDLKCLDPCMGSGHFVVGMFERLVALRIAEEILDDAAAVAAVIRDNLFGLEIDPRCTQIGAFNLALAAWRRVGHCKLPRMNLACSGLAPNTREADWLAVAGDSEKLRNGMERLFRLFKDAPVLGSLINPRLNVEDMFVADYHELQPLLERALAQETKEDGTHEMAVTAHGLARAAELLAGQFTLVATNVPYLGRGKQDKVLMDYCERVHPDAKSDLATCFIERCMQFCSKGGSATLVTPQNWMFLASYKKIREELLKTTFWNIVVRLGEHGFDSPQAAGAFVSLSCITRQQPTAHSKFMGFEASDESSPSEKAVAVARKTTALILQMNQLQNADIRIVLDPSYDATQKRLSEFVTVSQGSSTGDGNKFERTFWEVQDFRRWKWFLGAAYDGAYSGRDTVFDWPDETCELSTFEGARIQGLEALGKIGFAIAGSRNVCCGMFLGEFYNKALASLIPRNEEYAPPLWAFFESGSFEVEVRKLDQKLMISPGTFSGVPFDLAHWQKVTAEKYPHGLPKPFSNDPTQWLFNGHPKDSIQPLHVALARLLGYQWPRQAGSSFPDCPGLGPDGLEQLADEDGIACLPPINREQPAAHRLRALLAQALGQYDERAIIAATGSKKSTLEDWLLEDCFEQHCKLFHHRPFVWHIWDGRKDGFHVLVNYHRLDYSTLQKLTYSYLGDWIRCQGDDSKADKPGAAERLGAALTLQAELAKILEGEAPYDIFVRWKLLKDQPLGWHPDLNDGVRLNIRPFLFAKDVGKKGAGLLRAKPNINWDKDRGKEPEREKHGYPWIWCDEEPDTDPVGGREFVGHRWNSVHLTLARKKQAGVKVLKGT